MRTQEKEMLTAAFEALGPERVTRGLTATGHTWSDCFLALALREAPGAINRDLEKRWRKEYYVSTLIGVPLHVVQGLVRAWDQDETAVRALAGEWLELDRSAKSGARETSITVA